MKKILIILAGMIFPLWIAAQETPLSKLYDTYVSKTGYTTQEILPSSMSTMWEKDSSAATIRNIMDQIKTVRILSTDEEKKSAAKALKKSITKAAAEADYIKLMEVNSDDESIAFYGLKNTSTGNMKEFALTIQQDDEATLITVTGDMDMSTMFSKELMETMKGMGKNFHGGCQKEF
jgi:hypothetical protein